MTYFILKLFSSTKSSSALEINNGGNHGKVSEFEKKDLLGGDYNFDVVFPDENMGVMDEFGHAILEKRIRRQHSRKLQM